MSTSNTYKIVVPISDEALDRELTPEELQELSRIMSESLGRITNNFSQPLKDAIFKSFEKSFAPLLDFRAEFYTTINKSFLENAQKLSDVYVRLALQDIISKDMNDAISSFSKTILASCKNVTINPEAFMSSLMKLQEQLKTVSILDEYVSVSRADILNVCTPLNLDTGITDELSDSKFVFLSSERLKKLLFEILLVLIPMLHTQYLHNCDANQNENELQIQQEFYEEQLNSQQNYYEQQLQNQQNYYEQQLGINQENSNLLGQIFQILQYFEDSMQDSEKTPLPSGEIPQPPGQISFAPQEALNDTPELDLPTESLAPAHTVDEQDDID